MAAHVNAHFEILFLVRVKQAVKLVHGARGDYEREFEIALVLVVVFKLGPDRAFRKPEAVAGNRQKLFVVDVEIASVEYGSRIRNRHGVRAFGYHLADNVLRYGKSEGGPELGNLGKVASLRGVHLVRRRPGRKYRLERVVNGKRDLAARHYLERVHELLRVDNVASALEYLCLNIQPDALLGVKRRHDALARLLRFDKYALNCVYTRLV